MEITELLKQMKEADQPRKEETNKNPKKSNLTDKQKYLNGLMGRRK